MTSKKSQIVPQASALLSQAQTDGALSGASLQALTTIPDIGAQIQAALGVSAQAFPASEAVLVTLLIDDSGSIRFAGNAQLIRDGHNLVLDALAASKQKTGILVHTRYLNGHVLNEYRFVDQAERLTSQNYDPDLGTPLYDQTNVTLATVLAKTQEFSANGIPVRTVTLILSDGADMHSVSTRAQDVARLVRDMLASENHIVAAMGVDDGHGTDFRQIFSDMGIRPEWILTPGSSAKEIRRAFQVFSQSAVRASQNAATFSTAAAGGFGSQSARP